MILGWVSQKHQKIGFSDLGGVHSCLLGCLVKRAKHKLAQFCSNFLEKLLIFKGLFVWVQITLTLHMNGRNFQIFVCTPIFGWGHKSAQKQFSYGAFGLVLFFGGGNDW